MLRRAGYEFDFFVARNVIQTDVDSQVLSDFEKKNPKNRQTSVLNPTLQRLGNLNTGEGLTL